MSNFKPVKLGKNTRMSFGEINEVMKMPNLLEVQKESYRWFLDVGFKEVFRDIGEITDYSNNLVLTFTDYRMDEQPKYSVTECKQRDITYAAPLYLTAMLYNRETGEVKESKDIYMGDFPIMTESGTFVINGAERVIISQLVRSPGVYYAFTFDKNGKKNFTSTVIPSRGAWLEYETDSNDIFNVKIDKNRKVPITTFVRALGLSSNNDIREFFGDDDRIEATLEKDNTQNTEEALLEVYKHLRPGEPPTLETAQAQLQALFFDPRRYDISRVGRYKFNKKLSLVDRIAGGTLADDVIDPMTGEVLAEAGDTLNKDKAEKIDRSGVKVVVLDVDGKAVKVISNNMVDPLDFLKGVKREQLEAAGISEKVRFSVLKEILDACGDDKKAVLEQFKERADELVPKHIIIDDIFASVNYLNCLGNELGNVDDIDHLGNRRIRCVGELLQNQLRIGFTRMERPVRDKLGLQSQEGGLGTPKEFVNVKPVMAAIKEFFGSSPLSQFMDQTNPLAELTHKRRLSALGPGGLSRDRAGFEVRDVHYSHYGRMCPIETPEGPNIGLISYLATFARINKYGFVEAPYRKIDKKTGCVLEEVEYMTADVEDNFSVAQANEPLDKDGHFLNSRVTVRYHDEFREVDPSVPDYMDVSPKMLVSVATAMIPFLENDDANRALMGANMQRQAVPLLKTESPIVGTGMEFKAAQDSGVVVLAEHDGVVTRTSADKVEVQTKDGKTDVYNLVKFMRSNQGTCINQRPVVSDGDKIKKGDIIADGPATADGEISLGKNALIGFMTWEGYNYEDAVLLNEKCVRDDVFTSVHIEKHEIEARDTKLGAEEITRDIPNVGDDALANLDENGIIRIGAEVHSGDILVGKVTPKGETESTPEERLLRAIFGEKAREVRDTSLRVPHGEYGVVVQVDVFTKGEGAEELNPGVNKVVRCYIAQKRKISVGDKMAGRHGNKGVVSRILPQEDMPFLPDGTPLDIVLNPLGVPSRMNIGQVLEVHLGYAARALGYKVMTPVFDGAHEDDIYAMLMKAGICRRLDYNAEDDRFEESLDGKPLAIVKTVDDGKEVLEKLPAKTRKNMDELKRLAREDVLRAVDGKTWLMDGRTGRRFDSPVTVGVMYYLKLHHLVDDKIHARSTGPYSLVTQQPLGGKAQFGGQRFGEMEVWALEAYGAAYTLQEILTVKSDDVVGRVKTYESIVKGLNIPKPGVPESFKVLIKELQSLGLDVRVLDKDNNEIDLRQNFDDEISLPAIENKSRYDDEAFTTVNDAEGAAGYGTEDLDDEYQGESDDYTDDYDERNAEDE